MYVEGGFRKLNEITFLVLVGEKYLDGALTVIPQKCLKSFYQDEAFIIRANGDGQEQLFWAIPIDKEEIYQSQEIILQDYNSNITLLAFAIKSEDNQYETPCVVITNNLEVTMPIVKISTDDSKIQIMISTKFLQAIELYLSDRRTL